MRLLHIIPSLDWGSAERQLPLVMRCLPGEQFDQRLIVLRGGVPAEFPQQDRITALQLPRRLDLASCRRLRECIHDFAPDILHSWRHEACRLATVSCPSLPARRLVSVWRWRSTGDWLGRAADFATQLPLAARLAPSWMESSARFPAARLTSVTYGVGNEIRPAAKRQRRNQLAAPLGIPSDARLFGFVGPLLRESRVKDAIWCADLLKVVRDDVHLLIAGYGPMIGRLKAFRRQVQIEDRVHFLTQPRLIEQSLEVLDGVWITGQTSVGMPTLLEAMAHGIPVIATDLPCHRRYVDDQRSGLIVNLGHRAGFARQSLRLLEDPQLARRLAAEAQVVVRKRCAIEHVTQQYTALYRRLGA